MAADLCAAAVSFPAPVEIMPLCGNSAFTFLTTLDIHPHLHDAHIFLGAAVLLMTAKIVTARLMPRRAALLPRIGLTLLAAVIAVWVSSAAWFFIQYYTGLYSGN